MFRFGGMGGGGSGGEAGGGNFSSSTSNLSALAPPFKVDRLNPKASANPGLVPPEYRLNPKASANSGLVPPEYRGHPFTHPWQWITPSAPLSDPVVSSTTTTTVPLSDCYQFSASASTGQSSTQFSASVSIGQSSTHWSSLSPGTEGSSSAFGYGGEVEPYYSSYVIPLAGEDNRVVGDQGQRYNVLPTSSVTSQVDHTQSLSDCLYGSKWMDSFGMEPNGVFSSGNANSGGLYSYKNQLNQGGCSTENGKESEENFGVPYHNFERVSDREIHTGSLSFEHMDEDDMSCLGKNLGFFPYDSNKIHIPASSSTYPKSHPSSITCETFKNFSNGQNSYSPFEKCVRPSDTPFARPVSAVRSSPTVVIRPPPATNPKSAHRDDVGVLHTVDIYHSNPSSGKDSTSGLKPSFETKKDSFETNRFNFSEKGNGLVAVKDSRDGSDRKIKAIFGSPLPDINGFAIGCDNVQVVNSTEDDSSDFMDSPCWKGAPSSQISSFDVEAGNPFNFKKKMDEYGVDHDRHQKLHSMVNFGGAFSEKVEGNKNYEKESAGNGAVFSLEMMRDAILSSKECLLDHRIDSGRISTMPSSKGVEISDDSNMQIKKPDLLNSLTNSFDLNASDTKRSISEECAKMTLNDVSECEDVAVHAAEKVLASPASQEDATEHTVPAPKLNVPTMIKTMHNLSEFIMFQLSSESFPLEEENVKIVKQIISNLDTCLNKKIVQATHEQKPEIPVGDTFEKLGESGIVGTTSVSPNSINEAVISCAMLDSCLKHDRERNYSFPGKKDKKPPIFSPLMDDLDITKDDDMAKAMKNVLEENFHLTEEMHSESRALLFKNLWLDAEAKLCSVGFKARFDRMKIQMEDIKLKGQEDEVIAEMMSKVCVSPDQVTSPELFPKTHDATIPNPTLLNISSTPSTSGPTDDVEASVMARFDILKSRGDNKQPINIEGEKQPEMVVGGEHASSIMARFNILKSREETTSKSINTEEEEQPGMMTEGEFAGGMKPHFLHQTGSLGEDKFGSYVDGFDSPNEFHLSVANDPIIHSFRQSRMINQNSTLWRDNSSSDWEHVLKDDFSWKNF